MKITKKSKRTKIIIIVIAVLLVGGGVAYGFFRTQQNNAHTTNETRPMNDVDYSPATEEEKESVDQRKDEIIKEQEQNEQPPATQSISLAVTRASQVSAGQPLNVRTLINGANSGTCEVTLTKQGQPTVSKNFAVMFEATSVRCGSADIPASDFGASGEWNLKIIVKKDAQVSNTVEQTVTITK